MLLIDTGITLVPPRAWYADTDSDIESPRSPKSPKYVAERELAVEEDKAVALDSPDSADSPPPPYEHISIPLISSNPTVFPPEFPSSAVSAPRQYPAALLGTPFAPTASSSTALLNVAVTEALALGSFAIHQIQAVSSGLNSLLRRSGHLPGTNSWSLLARIALHLLKSNLSFHGLSMTRARMGSLLVAYGQPIPSGVKMQPIRIEVCREELIRFEKEGERCRRRRPRIALPKIVGEVGPDRYMLDGEFVEPDITGRRIRKRDWILNMVWSRKTCAPAGSTPSLRRKKVILYLHGGAYILGNTLIYRQITSRIAKETGCRVLAINYRLAPESAFPAAVHDAFAAFLWLTRPKDSAFVSDSDSEAFEPVAPTDVVFMGDSAGAGLVMALNHYLNLYLRGSGNEHLVPLPGASILLSPWLDLTFRSESWYRNCHRDWLPWAARNIHEPIARDLPHPVYMYLFGERAGRKPLELVPFLDGLRDEIDEEAAYIDNQQQQLESKSQSPENSLVGEDSETQARHRIHHAVEQFVRHPLVSPIFAEDLEGLPPILVQSGQCEVLVDESLALAHKYDMHNVGKEGNKGSYIRHEMYPEMGHVFQLVPWVPASKLAMKNVGRFLDSLENGGSRVVGEEERLEEERGLVIVDSHVFKGKDEE
ncbi:hypothetical protein HDV00_003196 [Rhizophlyctis rosea]|nr:hypothetical protein HDV00_003196 [Rhizophlyctis rosea]